MALFRNFLTPSEDFFQHSCVAWCEAKDMFFRRRTPTMIYVRESNVEKMGKIQDVSYEILNVLEFNRFVHSFD